jgi:hypothetical protein
VEWEQEHPTGQPTDQAAQRRRHEGAGPAQQMVDEAGREAQSTCEWSPSTDSGSWARSRQPLNVGRRVESKQRRRGSHRRRVGRREVRCQSRPRSCGRRRRRPRASCRRACHAERSPQRRILGLPGVAAGGGALGGGALPPVELERRAVAGAVLAMVSSSI